MLPGYVAGHYDHDQCHIDLVPLARLAGATLVHASAVKIDLDKKSIHVKSYYNNAGLGDDVMRSFSFLQPEYRDPARLALQLLGVRKATVTT